MSVASGSLPDAVWSAEGTTPDAIESALRELVKQRHEESGALAPSRALNMIVFVDSAYSGEIANRLARVGRYHASRLVVLSYEAGRTRLDARAVVATDIEPKQGELGLLRETVTVEIGERHLDDLVTIVDPLVVTDLATLLWSPHGYPEAVDELLELSQAVLVDSQDEPSWRAALGRACELRERAYVVDSGLASKHPVARAGGGRVRLARDARRAGTDREGVGAPPSRLDGRGDAARGLVGLAPGLDRKPADGERRGIDWQRHRTAVRGHGGRGRGANDRDQTGAGRGADGARDRELGRLHEQRTARGTQARHGRTAGAQPRRAGTRTRMDDLGRLAR